MLEVILTFTSKFVQASAAGIDGDGRDIDEAINDLLKKLKRLTVDDIKVIQHIHGE